MTDIEGIKTEFGLPPVSQIGVAVWDVDKAVDYYSSIFGIGPFTVYEFVPEKHWLMEEPSYSKIKMGKAMLGRIEFELIQPLEGKSIHKDFLESHGEGLHHLGFNVPNYDEICEKFLQAGFKSMLRAETYVETYKGHLKACYFDTQKVGGIIFEIIWKSWLPECRNS
jgi:4-hydroxyphenylpyruvate dioxygenase-like putative hemolysin